MVICANQFTDLDIIFEIFLGYCYFCFQTKMSQCWQADMKISIVWIFVSTIVAVLSQDLGLECLLKTSCKECIKADGCAWSWVCLPDNGTRYITQLSLYCKVFSTVPAHKRKVSIAFGETIAVCLATIKLHSSTLICY